MKRLRGAFFLGSKGIRSQVSAHSRLLVQSDDESEELDELEELEDAEAVKLTALSCFSMRLARMLVKLSGAWRLLAFSRGSLAHTSSMRVGSLTSETYGHSHGVDRWQQ